MLMIAFVILMALSGLVFVVVLHGDTQRRRAHHDHVRALARAKWEKHVQQDTDFGRTIMG